MAEELKEGPYWIRRKRDDREVIAEHDNLAYSDSPDDWVWWPARTHDYLSNDEVEVICQIPTADELREAVALLETICGQEIQKKAGLDPGGRSTMELAETILALLTRKAPNDPRPTQ